MTNEEALAELEKKISCYNAAISDCLFNCDICDRHVETDTLMSAIEVAAGVMRGVVEGKSPCADCGYGGKHLDAPPCTECPVYPKGV